MSDAGDGIEDDMSIPDVCRMLRRVPPLRISDHRPNSDNFLERDENSGLSVTAWFSNADLDAVISEMPDFAVCSVLARELRAAGFKIKKVPIDGNPNHCECFGKITKSNRKHLARAARWVKVPSGEEAAPFGNLEAF